jgi:hypothetical protein
MLLTCLGLLWASSTILPIGDRCNSVQLPFLGLASRVGKIGTGDTWTELPRRWQPLGWFKFNLPHLGFPGIVILIL